MKKYLLLVSFCICAFACFSQTNRDTFHISKNFFTGYKILKGTEQLRFGAAADAMLPNQEAYKLMKKAQANNTASTIFNLAGGFLIGFPIGTSLAGQKANWTLAAIGGGLVLASIPFNIALDKNARRAVELYNSQYRTTGIRRKTQLHLAFSNQSVGWVMRW
jgi:hypothetical protein